MALNPRLPPVGEAAPEVGDAVPHVGAAALEVGGAAPQPLRTGLVGAGPRVGGAADGGVAGAAEDGPQAGFCPGSAGRATAREVPGEAWIVPGVAVLNPVDDGERGIPRVRGAVLGMNGAATAWPGGVGFGRREPIGGRTPPLCPVPYHVEDSDALGEFNVDGGLLQLRGTAAPAVTAASGRACGTRGGGYGAATCETKCAAGICRGASAAVFTYTPRAPNCCCGSTVQPTQVFPTEADNPKTGRLS